MYFFAKLQNIDRIEVLFFLLFASYDALGVPLFQNRLSFTKVPNFRKAITENTKFDIAFGMNFCIATQHKITPNACCLTAFCYPGLKPGAISASPARPAGGWRTGTFDPRCGSQTE